MILLEELLIYIFLKVYILRGWIEFFRDGKYCGWRWVHWFKKSGHWFFLRRAYFHPGFRWCISIYFPLWISGFKKVVGLKLKRKGDSSPFKLEIMALCSFFKKTKKKAISLVQMVFGCFSVEWPCTSLKALCTSLRTLFPSLVLPFTLHWTVDTMF